MARCDKLEQKARTNPRGLRFAELLKLASCFSYQLDRQRGSHQVWMHVYLPRMTFQPDKNGMAKTYQVRQLLKAVDESNK